MLQQNQNAQFEMWQNYHLHIEIDTKQFERNIQCRLNWIVFEYISWICLISVDLMKRDKKLNRIINEVQLCHRISVENLVKVATKFKSTLKLKFNLFPSSTSTHSALGSQKYNALFIIINSFSIVVLLIQLNWANSILKCIFNDLEWWFECLFIASNRNCLWNVIFPLLSRNTRRTRERGRESDETEAIPNRQILWGFINNETRRKKNNNYYRSGSAMNICDIVKMMIMKRQMNAHCFKH